MTNDLLASSLELIVFIESKRKYNLKSSRQQWISNGSQGTIFDP